MNPDKNLKRVLNNYANGNPVANNEQNKDTFFAVVAIGVISAELLLMEYLQSNGILSVDGYNYILFTKTVLRKGWNLALEDMPLSKGIPPLLPLLMLLGSKTGLSLSITGRALNIAGTMLACQGILFLCFTLYKSRQTSFLTALMVCCLPKIYFEGCGILRDPLFWAEMTWCVYFLLQAAQNPDKSPKKQLLIYSGITILASLGCLTRKEGFPFLVLILLLSIILNIKNSFILLKYRIIISLFLLILSGVLIFLPYLFGIPYIPGDFILFMNGDSI